MDTTHLTEDVIEKYAMGKLPESKSAVAEEHLLVCQKCRDDVELIGLIVAGLREERCAGEHGSDTKASPPSDNRDGRDSS